MRQVPEPDALLVPRAAGGHVEQVARAAPGREDGVPEPVERSEQRGLAVPVGLGARERPRIAERRVEVERVEADRGRQEQQRREPRERAGVAAAPEQDRERRQEREPDQPRPGREAAEHAGEQRPPPHRREERARREREEEPLRVERGEDEADGIEGEVEDGVVGAALAEHGPRDLRQHPGRDRTACERDQDAGDQLRPGQPGEPVHERRVDGEERGRLRHLLVAVQRDLQEPACVPLRERLEEVVAEGAVRVADQPPLRRGRPDQRGRGAQPEGDADGDERRGGA